MTKLFLYYSAFSPGDDSHALLLRAASLYTNEPAQAFSVYRAQGKKPYFLSHPDLHFSISHSESLWCCLFAPAECGLDVQFQKSTIRWERLAERWFHAKEAEAVRTEQDFHRIWSRKEAFVKALGIGIDPRFRQFDTSADRTLLEQTEWIVRSLSLPFVPDNTYTAAAAYQTDFTIEYIPLSSNL